MHRSLRTTGLDIGQHSNLSLICQGLLVQRFCNTVFGFEDPVVGNMFIRCFPAYRCIFVIGMNVKI